MSPRKETQPVDDGAFLMGAVLAAAQKDFGQAGVYVATEDDKHYVGVPIPALALQWLIHSNVWPLQKITLSGGAPGSSKSALVFQILRWFLDINGMGAFIDTENKHSVELMRSMLTPEQLLRVMIHNAGSVEDWQTCVTTLLDQQRLFLVKQGRKPNVPLFAIVDSMCGNETDSVSDKITAEGAASRAYPEYTLLINTFLKFLDGRDGILGWPMSLHLTNHEKMKANPVNPNMPATPNRPGGRAPDFHASIDIRHIKGNGGRKRTLTGEDAEGNLITLEMRKNSFGPIIDKSIVVPFMWKFVADEAGVKHQVSWWDWDWALAYMLIGLKDKVKDVLSFDYVGKEATKEFWSETLGIDKEHAVDGTQFGARIQSSPELVEALQKALNIPMRNVYQAGSLDYPDDVERAKAYMKSKEKKEKKEKA